MDDFIRGLIRKRIKSLRSEIPHRQQLIFSHQITRDIFRQNIYRRAKNIALYMSTNGEVCLKGLWKTASTHGKYCYFPVLDGDKLQFYHATPRAKFEENIYGILEPVIEGLKPIGLEDLDLVIMPLVSFDRFGNRLGMGKGYYDKTFADISRQGTKRVFFYGVAYGCQRYPLLPSKEWDVPLDAIFTEEKIYEVS